MTSPRPVLLKDYKPPKFYIEQIDLTFDILDDFTDVTSVLKVKKNLEVADENTPLILDKGDFKIISVVANTMLLLPDEYQVEDEQFKLTKTPEIFELEIVTRLYPEKNTSLEGLYQSGNIICTQCEAQGFRKITPFPDRPDVMAIYSCTIIADKSKYPILLSNGNLVKSGDLGDNRHYVRWEDPFKKPSYLFALVAGDLGHIHDTFTTRSEREIELKIYSEHDNIHQCTHAMASLKQAMKWDEERFDLEYDLDLYQIVAINDFNAGAMENKGLNLFNSKYVLADSKSATDEDFMNIQGVIGHEYFHNWTGNRVTLRNWFQLSLKEGLTVFRDQEFSSDLNSRGVKRISSVRNLRAFQFPEDSGPMTHPVRPESYIKMDNFYTMTVYEKGAELVRMIHLLIGETDFQNGMKLYFKRFDGQAVTVEDFLKVMEDSSGCNLSQFKTWYTQSGTPQIKFEKDYDKETKELSLKFEQTIPPDRNQKAKRPLHIPIKFGILDKNGNDLIPEDNGLIELKDKKKTVILKNMPEGCLPSIFRQFSAPVKVQNNFSDKELAFLMARDSDDINRWDAAQTLFFNEAKKLVKAVQKKSDCNVSTDLINAFKTALQSDNQDRAFLAKMLTLPMETEIKDHFKSIDVESIHQARAYLKQAIAVQLKDELLTVIKNCANTDPQSIEQKDIAARSLKNVCLSYIGSIQEDWAIQMVRSNFNDAQNMTDQLAAFKILSQTNEQERDIAVKKFYSKWEQDKLVLDKWFAVQAGSMLPDTLGLVKNLLKHPDFSLKNPNKVRALIFMFAFYNPINFHRLDGQGYNLIRDLIIEIDVINQQVSARLVSCFNLWKKYDPDRQSLMKKALEQILNVQTLSKNVYEIVSRAL